MDLFNLLFSSPFPVGYYSAADDVRDLRGELNPIKSDLSNIESRLDRLQMINSAMWILMKSKLGIEDSELMAQIKAIDLSDGKLDGRVTAPGVICPKCQREVSPKRNRCLYCGHPLSAPPHATI